MPKIPQYQGGENIHTGSVGPQASPDAFGVQGLEAVGQGLANLGGSLEDIATRQKMLEARKKNEDERIWVGQSAQQLDRVLGEFHASEENQAKETFATDFDEFAKKQIQEYGKAAPSGRAGKAFNLRAGEVSGNYYNSAVRTANRTRLVNQRVAFEEQTGNALLSYRNNVKAGTPNPDELLAGSINQILDDIEKTFIGRPESLRAAKSHLIQQSVLATAGNDPQFAKDILDASPFIEEPLRKTLQAYIEQESKTQTAYSQEVQRQIMDKALDAGERGHAVEPADEAQLKQAFGDDRGAAMALSFNEKAGHINQANAIVAKLSDKNAGYQDAELSKLIETTHSDVLRRVQTKLETIQRQQQKDPAAFLRNQNEEVQAAYEKAMHFNSPAWSNVAHSISLKYQGYPPADAPPEEAAKYLSLPTGQRHVLPASEAKALGARLAQGSISDQLKVIDEMLAGYDEDHQFIAFNDLVTYADIPPALQLAHLNRGKTWLNEYINVALKPDILSKLTPEAQKTFSDELDKNAQWNLFTRSLYADGQRIREVGAWRSGIVAYANALAFKGEKPPDATAKAFKRLVEDNLGFPTVHGEPVMVSKVRRDGSMRNDQEIADYGRKLTNALREIPPQDIKILDDQGVPYFLSLPQLPEGDVLKQQHLRDIITSRGFYRPNPDGQSVSVYLVDDDGVEFQVRDKANQPLEIELDALPQFGKKIPSMVYMGMKSLNDPVSATYKIDPKAPVRWGSYWKNQGGTRSSRIKQKVTTLEGPK